MQSNIDNSNEKKEISYVQPSLNDMDKDGYLTWIKVPIPAGSSRFYRVEDLALYFQKFSPGQKIPDIVDPSFYLNHMKKRVDRQSKLDFEIQKMPKKEIDDLKAYILGELLHVLTLSPEAQIMCNIKHLVDVCFIVDLKTLMEKVPFFNSVDEFLSKKKLGFCFRKSLASNTLENSECTIFSMTNLYMDSENKIKQNNNRYLYLDGVGIYLISYFSSEELTYTSDMKTFLEYVNYKEPDYSCLTDMLIDPNHPLLLKQGKLDFNCLVRNE
jgi:hypothetical protein